MKLWTNRGLVGLVIAATMMLLGEQCHAGLSLDLNYCFSGTAPANTGQPWVSLLFQDQNDISTIPANQVQLTLSTAGLTSSENMVNLYLNLNPNLAVNTPGDWTISLATPPANYQGTFSSTVQEDSFMADGDGKYDVLLTFGTGTSKSGIVGPATAVIDFAYAGSATFNSGSFNFLSTSAGGAGPFLAASHIQLGGGVSGWIAAPEPNFTLAAALLLVPCAGASLCRKIPWGKSVTE
ncbi:MAG TPA: hypothetical protein VNZ64_09950 [Candidatus Acidoferrum sp.]|jgi:hypothetical protein|nr:hypothetical protein [Candidatus Acidoferrum sp.]